MEFNDYIYQTYYPGWGRTEAEADWKATGGSKAGGGGGSQAPSAEEIVKKIMEAQQESIDRETKFLEQYTADNPFIFDEALARKSAESEYYPYYSELLEDYLQDISFKRETIEDESKILRELYQIDAGKRSRAYDRAVARAEEGYAGKGMFFSGIKKRAIGEQEVEYGVTEQEAKERQEFQQRGLGREGEQLDTAEYRKRRDLFGGAEEMGGIEALGDRGGAYQAAMEGGVLQRREEAIKGYNIPLQQSYFRQFPSGSNQVQGYLVPEYLRY